MKNGHGSVDIFGLQHGLAPIKMALRTRKNGSHEILGCHSSKPGGIDEWLAMHVGLENGDLKNVRCLVLGTYKTTPTLDPFGGFGQLKLNATSHRFTCQQGEARSPPHQW